MTPLTRAVRRMSEATVRDGGKRRRLTIILSPNDTITLRPERTRRGETVTLEAVYQLAVKMRVAAERRDKKEARRARQKK